MHPLFTIGHSTHPWERFAALLRRHAIETVADVRSVPASRRSPHFAKSRLDRSLAAEGIRYVFLGAELGARRAEPEAYKNGVAAYERIAQLPAFARGLSQGRDGRPTPLSAGLECRRRSLRQGAGTWRTRTGSRSTRR